MTTSINKESKINKIVKNLNRNAIIPVAITVNPDNINFCPVEKKIHNHIPIARITGSGYKGILNGKFNEPFLFLKSITPIA